MHANARSIVVILVSDLEIKLTGQVRLRRRWDSSSFPHRQLNTLSPHLGIWALGGSLFPYHGPDHIHFSKYTSRLAAKMETTVVAGGGVLLLRSSIIYVVLIWVVFLMRVAVRLSRKAFGLDDYLMSIGVVCGLYHPRVKSILLMHIFHSVYCLSCVVLAFP